MIVYEAEAKRLVNARRRVPGNMGPGEGLYLDLHALPLKVVGCTLRV
jgi:hypothetical protein